jgi:hypothetical protein
VIPVLTSVFRELGSLRRQQEFAGIFGDECHVKPPVEDFRSHARMATASSGPVMLAGQEKTGRTEIVCSRYR